MGTDSRKEKSEVCLDLDRPSHGRTLVRRCSPWILGEFDRIGESIMNPVPANRMLFWACYLGGTLAPILGTSLIGSGRRSHDDSAFLLSWTLWLSGTVLLIAASWSVRTTLLGGAARSRRPLWLYRSVGWLALVELLLWGYTVGRAI
jgi:hypothetical protein